MKKLHLLPIISLCFVVYLFSACEKMNPLPPDDDPSPNCGDSFPSHLELNWVRSLNPDTLKDRSAHLGFIWENVFYQSFQWDDAMYSQFLVDRENGDKIWTKHFSNTSPSYTDGPYPVGQNAFIMHSRKATYLFDQTDGHLITAYSAPHPDSAYGPQIKVHNNKVYRVHTETTGGRYARLVEMDPYTGAVDRVILYLYRDHINGLHPTFTSFQIVKDTESGNDLLVFLMKAKKTGSARVDLYACDLTTGQIKYHYNDVTESGNASLRGLLVRNKMAYIQGAQSVYCYSLENGNKEWSRLIEDLSVSCNIILENGMLIINPDNEKIIALHPNGTVRWQRGDDLLDFSDPTAMTYHDNYVYFGSRSTDKLSGVHVLNPDASWSAYSPLAKVKDPCVAGFNTAPTIDTTGNMLYANDNYFLMAFELPQ